MANLILATDDAAPNEATDDFALDDPAEFAKAARLDVHHGPLTEQTLAERMVHRHGKDLRFCTTHGWLVWNTQRWRRDDLLEVHVARRPAAKPLIHRRHVHADARLAP